MTTVDGPAATTRGERAHEVGFIMLYARGTVLGKGTGGSPEAIPVSLPPEERRP